MRLTILMLTVLAVATTARAAEDGHKAAPSAKVPATSSSAEPGPLGARIGTPAHEHAVTRALAQWDRDDLAASRALARALAQCGGVAAAKGLVSFVRSTDAQVRRAGLEAARDVGLRHPPLVQAVRDALKDRDERVLIAAVQALSVLGDGSEMKTFLALARDKRRLARLEAFRALRAFTGVRLPNVHALWKEWWRQRSKRGSAAVRSAIANLEGSELEPEGQQLQVEALLADAWIELPLVRTSLEKWLYAANRDLRRIACQVVGQWRLTEFAQAVEAGAKTRWAREDLKQASAEALQRLGVRTR